MNRYLLHLKNFSVLSLGNILVIGLNFVLYPILSRLYGPEQFGEYSKFILLATVFSMLISFQTYLKLFKVDNKDLRKEANNIINLSFLGFLIIVGISFFFEYWVTVAAILSFMIVVNEIGKILYNRERRFLNTVKLNLINRLVTQSGRIIGKRFLEVNSGLMIFEVLGYFLSSVYFFISAKIKVRFQKIQIKFSEITYYFSFSMMSFLVDEWGLLVLAKLYPVKTLGLYFVFTRLVLKPVAIIGNNFASIFINKLHDESVHHKFLKLFIIVSVFIIPVLVIFNLWGPQIFTTLLGEKYLSVGTFAATLSFLILVKLIKGTIQIRSSQTDKLKTVISIRTVILLGYICVTYYFNQDLLRLLTLLGLLELVGEFLLLFMLLRNK